MATQERVLDRSSGSWSRRPPPQRHSPPATPERPGSPGSSSEIPISARERTAELPRKPREGRMTTDEDKTTGRRVLTGRVVSDKMDKTVTVEVTRRVKHGKYQKILTRRKNYKAHD